MYLNMTFLRIRQQELILILRAMNQGTASTAQLQKYSKLITDIWIDKKVDITIKNSKARTSSTFWKNIVNLFPVPTV